jgi:hypothetical protein
MKKIIGYQIVSNNGENNIPDEFYSFEIFDNIDLVIEWLENEKESPRYPNTLWIIFPVFEGDIENPTIMF